MEEKRILVISNKGLSNNESNGRILSLLLHNYDNKNKHNYCLGGCLDIKDVHYIKMNDKRNIKSLCSFGIVKPELGGDVAPIGNGNNSTSIKHKKAFHYYVRNVLYSINFHITKYMKKYVVNNDIDVIFLFGSDAPYLYRLARKLSTKTNKELIIYTCEDYPLKEYNYISRGKDKDIFCKMLHHSLYKETKKAYEVASKSFFNSEPLKEAYLSKIDFKNAEVRYLPSLLTPVDYKPRPIKNIVYGGNLYHDRVISLLDILEVLSKIDSSVKVNLYGNVDATDLSLLDKYNNVKYHGIVKYDELIKIYKNADMLLHMEGFSDYSIINYKYAFSTKISDCYMLGIPFFMYSPIEIASTKYGLGVDPDYTATTNEELINMLKKIINNNIEYVIDKKSVVIDFTPSNII